MDEIGANVNAAEAIQTFKASKNDINLLNLIQSRITEIIHIEDECRKKLPKLYNQRLPRFMRRRAASHNPKRLPTRLRPPTGSRFGTKDRDSLLKYRRRLRFRKHKRILKKHSKHPYKDIFKSLLHKWFAKRFKMGNIETAEHIPLFNSTKNQRNLYRQSLYGCAYLSLIHLMPIRITPKRIGQSLSSHYNDLNRMTSRNAGFTFGAKSLKTDKYEIVIHLYRPDKAPEEYLCPAVVSMRESVSNDGVCTSNLLMWVPRWKYREVYLGLEKVSKSLKLDKIFPRDQARVRLVGPLAQEKALTISENKGTHLSAMKEAQFCLSRPFGLTIGRVVHDSAADFTYYETNPTTLDIVFRSKEGKMLWYKLVKNKAHLVGGHRDVDRLLLAECFKLKPDF